MYYNETHSREYIDVDAELRQTVKDMFGEMHELYRRGYTPKVKPAAKCGRCSLNGICLPSLMRRQKSVSGYIAEHMEGIE